MFNPAISFKRVFVCLIALLCLTTVHWCLDGPNGYAKESNVKAPTKIQSVEERWLSEWRECVEEDQLYLYAVKLFKAPVDCKAKITDTFDGQNFGTLLFSFTGGNWFRLETFPPEASRTTLRVPKGFPDEKEARSMLEQYLREMGLGIDWSKPIQQMNGTELMISFGALEPGWNAFANLVYEDHKLVEISFSLAL